MTLSDRRKAAGYSRHEASKALHVDTLTLDEIEARRKEPTERQMRCMARLYRCETRELETCLDRRTLHGWRVSEAMSKAALGKLVGRTRDAVAHWEDGLLTPPQSIQLQLAKMMGISPLDLAENEGWWCDGEEDGKCRK